MAKKDYEDPFADRNNFDTSTDAENAASNSTDNIEIFSTEDDRIKSFGELLTNDSSRTVLQILMKEEQTALQLSQRTDLSLPLVIYHLNKMLALDVIKVSRLGVNTKGQDMKYYRATKFAIVILPSTVSEKAKESKSLLRSFRTIYRFAGIGIAGIAAWFGSTLTGPTAMRSTSVSLDQSGQIEPEVLLADESTAIHSDLQEEPIRESLEESLALPIEEPQESLMDESTAVQSAGSGDESTTEVVASAPSLESPAMSMDESTAVQSAGSGDESTTVSVDREPSLESPSMLMDASTAVQSAGSEDESTTEAVDHAPSPVQDYSDKPSEEHYMESEPISDVQSPMEPIVNSRLEPVTDTSGWLPAVLPEDLIIPVFVTAIVVGAGLLLELAYRLKIQRRARPKI